MIFLCYSNYADSPFKNKYSIKSEQAPFRESKGTSGLHECRPVFHASVADS